MMEYRFFIPKLRLARFKFLEKALPGTWLAIARAIQSALLSDEEFWGMKPQT